MRNASYLPTNKIDKRSTSFVHLVWQYHIFFYFQPREIKLTCDFLRSNVLYMDCQNVLILLKRRQELSLLLDGERTEKVKNKIKYRKKEILKAS